MTNGLRRPSLQEMLIWLLAALLIGALAACSQATNAGIPTASESQEPAAGETNSAQAETTPAAQEPAAQGPEDAGLAYSQCIRENGVPDFPDPDAEGRILIRRGSVDPESAVWREATDACRHLAPEGWGDAANVSPEDQEVMLEFARCMRENGLPDFPDPDPNAGARITLDPDSRDNPNAQAALEICQPILQEMQGKPAIGG